MLISLNRGRDQKWFDGLDSGRQKEYLAAHPKSKFGSKTKQVQKPKSDGAVNHEKIKMRIAALRKALGSESDHLDHLRKKPKRDVEEIARVGKNIVRIRIKIKELRDQLVKAEPVSKPVVKTTRPKPVGLKTGTKSPVAVKPKVRPSAVARPPRREKEHPKPAHHVLKQLGRDERDSVNEALKSEGINAGTATADHVQKVAEKQLKSWTSKHEKAKSVTDQHHAKSWVKHWTNLVGKIKQVLGK